MQKIISLFQRNYDGDHLVRDEVVPGAEWVLAGEGVATRKWDGTCCRIKDGNLYKRHEVKKGKTAPAGFEASQEPDKITGDVPGWVQCDVNNKADRWHWEAFSNLEGLPENGTFELCGPAINKNPEQFDRHELIRHGEEKHYFPQGISFDFLKRLFQEMDMEGLVWHHPDGRMVKIKAKDFGIKR